MVSVSLWGQHHCFRENPFLRLSNCFCRHPCWLGKWNKQNDRSNFFCHRIGWDWTTPIQKVPLKSSAQSSEASSPKQRASGRELSLCLLSPNSTNSERNICSIRKRDWQTTVKLVVGTFQVPLSTTTTTKTDLENEPSKTSQQSIIAMFSKSHFHSHQLSPQFPGRSCVPMSPIDSLHINRFVSTSKRLHN